MQYNTLKFDDANELVINFKDFLNAPAIYISLTNLFKVRTSVDSHLFATVTCCLFNV